MKFTDLINEALDPTNWLNLNADTTNASEYQDPIFLETSEHIQRLLEEPDQTKILFISPELGLGADFLLFDKDIIPHSAKVKDHAVVNGTVMNYLHLYKYQDIPFVLAEFRDTYEYGYVFIVQDQFDAINQLIFPETAGAIQSADGNDDDMFGDQELQEETGQDDLFGEPGEAQVQEDEFGAASSESSQDNADSSQMDAFPQNQDEDEDEGQKSNSLLDGP